MKIREARDRDIGGVLCLLSQVLEIHAAIRPDIFISGTTKYTAADLSALFRDETRPVFVAVDEEEKVLGYAICMRREAPDSPNLVPFTSLYIDDLCVDEGCRKAGVGQALLSHVLDKARHWGCYEVTLNLWEGNGAAQAFYEKMGFKVKKRELELILTDLPDPA